jgi:hypothetical protein
MCVSIAAISVHLPLQTFFVHRHLDSDVRIFHILVTTWIRRNCAVISGIAFDITDRTEDLEQTCNHGGGEEESESGR